MKHPESDLQQSCVKWFRYQYPELKRLLFSIPNGGFTDFQRKIKSAEGMVSGVCDLFLSYPSNGFHGMYIEMKSGKNTLSINQEEFISDASSAGYKCVVCYSFDEFEKEVNNYLQ